MNKLIKRSYVIVLVVLFALLVLLGLTPKMTFAHAESVQDNGNIDNVRSYASNENDNYETYLSFTLTSDGKGYKVRAKNKTLTEITIPSVYNGLAITEIYDNGFMSCRNLKTVFIPSSVKKIGTNAFYSCTSLERVYGAINVEIIGNSAFYGCTKLKYFCIYNSIATLGSTIFRNIPNDIYVRMAEEEFLGLSGINSNWATGRASSSQIIYGTDQICEMIDETNVNEGYKLVKAHEISENITRTTSAINYLLDDNKSGDEAYIYRCSEDGEPIREIKSGAFESFNSKKIIIAYDIDLAEKDFEVFIESNAFSNMPKCEELEINVNISIEQEEDGEAIYSESLFTSSQNLKTVIMPDELHVIPASTFADCISLTTLKYRDSENENILSDKINYIDSFAFAQCYSMAEITIPSSVTKMGASIFQDWGGENYMTCETKDQTINFNSFLPPESTDKYDTWDNGLGENVTVNYNTITLELDNQGGIGGAKEVEAMYGRNLETVEAPTPSQEYLEFGGYYSEINGGGTPYYDEKMNCLKEWGKEEIDAEIDTLFACWKKKDIPIKLIIDDLREEKITVKFDEKFGKLSFEFIDKAGYKFDGFYSKENGYGDKFFDNKLNPTDKVYDDISIDTLYAHWIPERYKVSLLPGDGSSGTQTVYIDYGTKNVYLDENNSESVSQISAPTWQNHEFTGYFFEGDDNPYFTAVENDGKIYAVCRREWDKPENNSLVAGWTPKSYTISFDTNGGQALEPVAVAYGETKELPTPTYENGEHKFGGWLYESEPFTSGNTYLLSDNIELTANWICEHSVTFITRVEHLACEEVKIKHGNAIGNLPEIEFFPHKFEGWYLADNEGYKYGDWWFSDAIKYIGDEIITDDINLVARWSIAYTVSLKLEDGNDRHYIYIYALLGYPMPDKDIDGNQLDEPMRLGYSFDGFYTEPDGEGDQYYEKDMSSKRNWDLSNNTTLYAKWTIDTYEITYSGVIGENPYPLTYTYGTSIKFSTSQRPGYDATWTPAEIKKSTLGNLYVTVRYSPKSLKNCKIDNDTYEIWTASQFKEIETYGLEDCTFYLKEDISLGYNNHLPYYVSEFRGMFYGSDHIISEVSITVDNPSINTGGCGLFGVNYGYIEKLNVMGAISTWYEKTSSEAYAGILCGINEGFIQYCKSFNNSYGMVAEVKNVTYGGLVGRNDNILKNVENYAGICSYRGCTVGGVVGYCSSASTNNYLYNHAEIKYYMAETNVLGGVIGILASGATAKNCINYGKIIIVSYDGEIAPGIGSIIGKLYGNYESSCNYGLTYYDDSTGELFLIEIQEIG